MAGAERAEAVQNFSGPQRAPVPDVFPGDRCIAANSPLERLHISGGDSWFAGQCWMTGRLSIDIDPLPAVQAACESHAGGIYIKEDSI